MDRFFQEETGDLGFVKFMASLKADAVATNGSRRAEDVEFLHGLFGQH